MSILEGELRMHFWTWSPEFNVRHSISLLSLTRKRDWGSANILCISKLVWLNSSLVGLKCVCPMLSPCNYPLTKEVV